MQKNQAIFTILFKNENYVIWLAESILTKISRTGFIQIIGDLYRNNFHDRTN